VQNLYSLNVPAPAIAAVVERMVREGGTPQQPAESHVFGGDVKSAPPPEISPPRYEDNQ
jgi:hypothetical protein